MFKKINQTPGILPVLAIILFMIIAQACGSEDPKETPKQQVSVQIEVAELVSFEQSIPYSGSVISFRSTGISTKIMGEIVEMDLKIGDSVQKDDLLLRIRNEQLAGQKDRILANMEESTAALQNTKINFDRIEALYNQKSATQKEFDDMKTELSMAESRVAALNGSLKEVEELIGYTELRAPFPSTIAAKMAEVGDMANPGQPLLQLNEKGKFKIRITVPEQDIGRFNAGDKAIVSISSADIENAEVYVIAVNRNGSAASRQFDVEFILPDQKLSEKLNSGQFATVKLQYDSDPVIAVKSDSILRNGQLTGLYTLSEKDQILLRWVRTGKEKNGLTEILSGIRAGERYIIPGGTPLKEGFFVSGNQ
ncbi:MAG: efflux RND transporter periplasmic adaptor subunit [Balneolaceae bacterium]